MKKTLRFFALALLVAGFHLFGSAGCGGGSNPNGQDFVLTVTVEGQGTITSSPAGIDCGDECDAPFASGSQVTLSADAAQGYRFTGWSGGGCSGTETCTVTLDADTEVNASFEILQIVFTSDAALDGSQARNENGVSNIWLMNADASDRHPITSYTGTDISVFQPQWSPDGSLILFTSDAALDGSNVTLQGQNIWVMNADGSNPAPLTQYTVDGAEASDAQWSPDGTQIVYRNSAALNGDDAANTNFTFNIWVMDADGGNATPLTELTADFADSYTPQWSPNGEQIAYASSRALNGSDATNVNAAINLWVMSANGSDNAALTDLTSLGAQHREPQWSPNGSQIAIQSNRNLDVSIDSVIPTNNIWVINSDGSNLLALTQLDVSGATNLAPHWSPSGTLLTFASEASLDGSNAANTNFGTNIWTMAANGQNRMPLTHYSVLNMETFEATFTPDGSQVMFASEADFEGGNAPNAQSSFNIFLINLDGTGLNALTQVVADKTGSAEASFRP